MGAIIGAAGMIVFGAFVLANEVLRVDSSLAGGSALVGLAAIFCGFIMLLAVWYRFIRVKTKTQQALSRQ